MSQVISPSFLDDVEEYNNLTPDIRLSGTSEISVGGNFSNASTNQHCSGQILVGNSSSDACKFTVGGNFTWSHSALGSVNMSNPEQIYVRGTGIFDVDGNFSYTVIDNTHKLRGLLRVENTALLEIGSSSGNSHLLDVYNCECSGADESIRVGSFATLQVNGDLNHATQRRV